MKNFRMTAFIVAVTIIAMAVSYQLFGSIDWPGVAAVSFVMTICIVFERLFGDKTEEIEEEEESREGR